jgi:hypothetical protein
MAILKSYFQTRVLEDESQLLVSRQLSALLHRIESRSKNKKPNCVNYYKQLT